MSFLEIKKPEEYTITQFDGIDASEVYTGSFDSLVRADLDWHEEYSDELYMDVKTLSLKEISDQLKSEAGIITVFINEPLRGRVLQYGNYGDSWWEVGELSGYA